MVAILNQLNGYIYALEQALGVDTAQYEASFVECLRPLGASADAHGRERMTNARKERALLWQCAAIAHHCKGIHLQAVVIVEAERLVLNDALINLNVIFSFCREIIDEKKNFCLVTNPRNKLIY